MAAEPLAQVGNFLHVYDFRVRPGTGDQFIRQFEMVLVPHLFKEAADNILVIGHNQCFQLRVSCR